MLADVFALIFTALATAVASVAFAGIMIWVLGFAFSAPVSVYMAARHHHDDTIAHADPRAAFPW